VAIRLPAQTLARIPALFVAAGFSLAVGLFVEPWVGIMSAGFTAALVLRPFEPVTALAVFAAAASLVNNEGGRVARDLAVVTVVGMYALLAILLAQRQGRWRAPAGPMALALLGFLAWTAVATVRGVLAGYSIKFILLEVAALGSIAYAWLAGGLRITSRDLRPALVVLVLAGLVHVGLGLVSYVVNKIRTGGIWYTPLPGMLAVVALAFGARARTWSARLGWALLLAMFLLHQVISFSRGYWLGLLAALPCTAFMIAGWGPGAWPRWQRVIVQGGIAVSVLVVLTLFTAVFMGWTDLPELIGTRFGSSFSTKGNAASASNLERLMEYGASFRHIRQNPVLGYGMGLELRIKEPFRGLTTRQPFIHQSYIWLWLKQGLIGLVLYITLLVQALRTALAGARSPDREAAAWCRAAAGSTIYLAVVNMTTYHIAQVDSTVTQALLWGFALATTHPPHWRLVWRTRPAVRPALGEARPG
jgi:O-antigen ligase